MGQLYLSFHFSTDLRDFPILAAVANSNLKDSMGLSSSSTMTSFSDAGSSLVAKSQINLQYHWADSCAAKRAKVQWVHHLQIVER